jgi:photosystem II stability/assembly factor-like uncharacterized protein
MKFFLMLLFLLISYLKLFSQIDPKDDSTYWIGKNWFFTSNDSIVRMDNRKGMQFSEQIHFKDSLNGLLFINLGYSVPIVFRTTNGGNFWNEIFREQGWWEGDSLVYVQALFSKASVINNQVILATKYDSFLKPTDTSYIFRSTDFGETFTKIDLDCDIGFWDICMLNAKYGAMLCSHEFVETNDSGITWKRSKPFPVSISYPDFIQVVGEGKIFCSKVFYYKPDSDLNRIYYTPDNGESWEEIKPPAYHVYRTHFFNEWEGIIIGYDSLYNSWDNKLLAKFTSDRGKTWRIIWDTTLAAGVYTTSVRELKFHDRNNGIFMGDNGVIFQTTDGGNNWSFIGPKGVKPQGKSSFPFSTFDFAGKNKILCLGVLWAFDEILHIPLDIPLGVENNIEKNEYFIYPNPATDYIVIQPSEGSKIEIFDMLGVNVSSADGGIKGGGRLDISYLSAGIYYIKFGKQIEKFVKL